MKVLKLFKQIPASRRRQEVDAFIASLSDAERKAWQRWFPDETVEHIHLLRVLRGKPFCVIKGGMWFPQPAKDLILKPYQRGPQRPNGGGNAA